MRPAMTIAMYWSHSTTLAPSAVRIVAVISDRYLKSSYCMYELFHTYRNCADDPDKFLDKVVPLILPDATLHPVTAMLNYAIYWKKEKEELKEKIETPVDLTGDDNL